MKFSTLGPRKYFAEAFERKTFTNTLLQAGLLQQQEKHKLQSKLQVLNSMGRTDLSSIIMVSVSCIKE